MIRKRAIIGSSVTMADIVRAASCARASDIFDKLKAGIGANVGCRNIFLTNSGTAALYIILKALSAGSQRTEVVLPAYTAGSLVVAVRKAGLKPVLCDISLEDFNADPDSAVRAISDRTLAVVAVHMFGIGMDSIVALKGKLPPGVTLIEDCAQAMGSRIGGVGVGKFGDVSFFSFSRGKNLSACGGGCIATDDIALAALLKRTFDKLPPGRDRSGAAAISNLLAFSIAVNPYIYGAFYKLISRFKETTPPVDFDVRGISAIDASLVLTIIGRAGYFASRRYENGSYILRELKGLDKVRLPVTDVRDKPAYNRLPVVFGDRIALERAQERLWRSGVESSRMYLRPLHRIFDLGYGYDELPNSSYLAERLLTLPTHQSVNEKELTRIVDAVRGAIL